MSTQVTSSTKWLKLNPDEIAPFERPKDAPWSLSSPSPYIVPTMVRAEYSTATGHLCVAFQYITEEEAQELQVTPYCVISIGRRTKRIFSLDFNIHQYNRDRKLIEKAAKDTFDSLPPSGVANAPIVSRAFSKRSSDLLQVATR